MALSIKKKWNKSLLENNIKVVKIGDCKDKASDIENAIKTAYDAANEI